MDATHKTAADSPLTRYARATGPAGWLTPAGWSRLAGDLYADALRLAAEGQHGRAQQAHDRAEDCRQRAAWAVAS